MTTQLKVVTPNDIIDNINDIYDIQVTSVNSATPTADGNVDVLKTYAYADLGGYAGQAVSIFQADLLSHINTVGTANQLASFSLRFAADLSGLATVWNAGTGNLANGSICTVTITNMYLADSKWNAHLTFVSYVDRAKYETQLVAGTFTAMRQLAYAGDATTAGVLTVNGMKPDTAGAVTVVNIDGNAATATTTTGNAATSTKLATSRTIGLGGVTATSQSFDGSKNITIPITAVPATLITGTLTNDTTGNATTATTTTGNAATSTLAAKATADAAGHVLTSWYAPLASPALTGTPTAPTAAATANTTQLATTAFVQTAVSQLVSSAPATLDTLNELATALGNDPNFATSMTTLIGTKLDATEAVGTATANKLLRLNANSLLPTGITGNAATSTKATQDSLGQDLVSTYIKGVAITNGYLTTTLGDASQTTAVKACAVMTRDELVVATADAGVATVTIPTSISSLAYFVASNLLVYQNGIILSNVGDYSIAAGVVTLTNNTTIAGDVFTFVYIG